LASYFLKNLLKTKTQIKMKKSLPIFFLLLSVKVIAQSGISWNMGMNISTNTYSNMHPRMTLNGAGNPMVIWGRMSDQSCFFSRWTGSVFTAPVKLSGAMPVASTSWYGSDIASHGDTVYVVMRQSPESADTSKHIYIVRSFDGGQNFSSPVRVDFIGSNISRFPTVTTDAVGNPIVAFMKFNNSFIDSRWVVTKSDDYGKTFSADVKASGWGSSAEVCDCCPGAIVTEGSKSALLYRDNNSNIRDNWMGVSTDNAASFTNGCNIDKNNWMINSCPSSGPDGVAVGDTVYSTFMSSGSGSYRNYFSKASLSSISTRSVTNLTGQITGLSQQNFPRIASNGKAMAIVWKQTVNAKAQLPILFTNDIKKGFPTAYDTVDLVDITNADVAVANGKVWVVWEDDNAQTVKFRSGTFIPITTGIMESISQNLFSIFPNPATNSVHITLANVSGKLTVNNLLGQEIFSKLIYNHTELNTTEWSIGVYFITMQSGQSIFTQKFLKE